MSGSNAGHDCCSGQKLAGPKLKGKLQQDAGCVDTDDESDAEERYRKLDFPNLMIEAAANEWGASLGILHIGTHTYEPNN